MWFASNTDRREPEGKKPGCQGRAQRAGGLALRPGAPRAVVAGTLGENPERRAMPSKPRRTTKTEDQTGRAARARGPASPSLLSRQRRRATGWAGEAWAALRAGGWASTTPRRRRGARAEPGRGSQERMGERRDSGLWLARRSPGPRLGGGRMIDSRPADHQAVLRSDHRQGRRQGGAPIARCGPSPSPSTTRRKVGREALEPRRRLEGPLEDGPEGRSPAGHALLPRGP